MSREREDKPRNGKKFARDTSDKGLLYKIYEELLKLNNMKTTQSKKSQRP